MLASSPASHCSQYPHTVAVSTSPADSQLPEGPGAPAGGAEASPAGPAAGDDGVLDRLVRPLAGPLQGRMVVGRWVTTHQSEPQLIHPHLGYMYFKIAEADFPEGAYVDLLCCMTVFFLPIIVYLFPPIIARDCDIRRVPHYFGDDPEERIFGQHVHVPGWHQLRLPSRRQPYRLESVPVG